MSLYPGEEGSPRPYTASEIKERFLLGSIQYSPGEKIWKLFYENDVICPFFRDKKIIAGTYGCIHCLSFISVDRNRNNHTTLVKCRGHGRNRL
jgi:hypothetical protein